MSVQTFVSIPSLNAPVSAALGATTASAEIIFGSNVIIEINCTADLTVAFGVSGMSAPTAASFRIPANVPYRWDLGNVNNRIRLYNAGASSSTYYIQEVTKLDK